MIATRTSAGALKKKKKQGGNKVSGGTYANKIVSYSKKFVCQYMTTLWIHSVIMWDVTKLMLFRCVCGVMITSKHDEVTWWRHCAEMSLSLQSPLMPQSFLLTSYSHKQTKTHPQRIQMGPCTLLTYKIRGQGTFMHPKCVSVNWIVLILVSNWCQFLE